MTETNHDRWGEEIAAYLLGALEPEQATALERHAEGCERCRAEIHWLMPAMRALPEGVEPVEPPPELRGRLMAEVRTEARQAGAERASAEGGLRHRAAAWLRGLGSGPTGLRPVAGVAAAGLILAAVAAFAIGGGIGGGSDGSRTSTVVSGHAPGVTAKVVREGDGGTLQLADVRPLPTNRVLQAWVRREGKIEPVPALFVPDREGRANTAIADLRGVDAVMVTTEPPGGSKAPTSTPIITIPIPTQ
jgi:anti-sigma-K factor RskA